MSLVERIGAALVAPSRALSGAASKVAAGKAGTDVALLIALVFAVAHTDTLISSLWTVATGEVGGGLMTLLVSLTHSASRDLIFLFAAAGVIWLGSGAARNFGRDFDLACVAYVPLAVVSIATNVVARSAGWTPSSLAAEILSGIAYTWAGAVVLLAVAQNRRGGRPEARPTPRSRTAGLSFFALAAVGLILSGTWIARNPGVVRPVVAGDLAPDFRLPTIDESGQLAGSFELSQLRGKVVVLDFWATWCGPCRESMPALEALHREYGERGVVVVSINTEGPDVAAKARSLVSSMGLTTTQLSDDGRVSNLYKVTTIPHMVVVDQQGHVRDVHRGFSSKARLERQLREVIDALL